MKKAAIIHGTKATPNDNWFPWLKSELEKLEIETFTPKLPTPEGQSLNNWLEQFNLQVGKLDSDSVLIGHSV